MATAIALAKESYRPGLNPTRAYKALRGMDLAPCSLGAEEQAMGLMQVFTQIATRKALTGLYWEYVNLRPVPGPCGVIWGAAVIERYPELRHV